MYWEENFTLDGIGPQELQIGSLVEKVKSGAIKVILALSTTVRNLTPRTILFTSNSAHTILQMSVLAGVSVGDELEYTDEIFLVNIVKRIPLMEQSKTIDLSVIIVSYNVEHFKLVFGKCLCSH